MIRNIFSKEVTNEIINRINTLTTSSKNLWGKMTVSKMLAHLNVTYEMVYENKYPKPSPGVIFYLRKSVMPEIVGDTPYDKHSRTAPQFVIQEERNFSDEKFRLLEYLHRTQELGEDHFHMKESHSFGKLTKQEWSNLFYKHLDHHLKQFNT